MSVLRYVCVFLHHCVCLGVFFSGCVCVSLSVSCVCVSFWVYPVCLSECILCVCVCVHESFQVCVCEFMSAWSYRGHDKTTMYVCACISLWVCVCTHMCISVCVCVYICDCVYLMCTVGGIILHPHSSTPTPSSLISRAQERCSPGGLSSLPAPMTDAPVEHPGSIHRATAPHTHMHATVQPHTHTFGRGSSFMKRTNVFRYETKITLFFHVLFR